MMQSRGRSFRGTRATKTIPRLRARNISVCCTMMYTGMLHYQKQDRAFNKESFLVFLDGLFAKLAEKGMRNVKIIMDNVPFHRAGEIKGKITSFGHVWNHLLPYSPFLNPIENMFAEWKNMIRSLEYHSEQELLNNIDSTFSMLSGKHCLSYYRHMLNMVAR
jgi:transposase